MQTKEGVAKKFVDDLKKAVDHIMKQPDRKLGKIVNFIFQNVFFNFKFI